MLKGGVREPFHPNKSFKRTDRNDQEVPSGFIPRQPFRYPLGRSHRGIGRRYVQWSRCKGYHVLGPFLPTRRVSGNDDSPGGIPGARSRSVVGWRRAAPHILSDPILASVPGRSLGLIDLSEVSGEIFSISSHDHCSRQSIMLLESLSLSQAGNPSRNALRSLMPMMCTPLTFFLTCTSASVNRITG